MEGGRRSTPLRSVNAAEIGFFAEKGPTDADDAVAEQQNREWKEGRDESEKFVLANQSFGRGKQH